MLIFYLDLDWASPVSVASATAAVTHTCGNISREDRIVWSRYHMLQSHMFAARKASTQ